MTDHSMPPLEWRIDLDDANGATLVADYGPFHVRLYVDGCEWGIHFTINGHQGWGGYSRKCVLADVVAWCPEYRDEAVGMTRAALFAERARLAEHLSDGLTALAAGDDVTVNHKLDDLRTWGTEALAEELLAVGESA